MIDEELKEVLEELINIAFGSATAMIAALFDNFATLRVPNIGIVPIEDIQSTIMQGAETESIYLTTQGFKGGFEGEIVFTLDNDSAKRMQAIIGSSDDLSGASSENDLEIKQSVLEIANILGCSCIGKLAELLESDVTFSPPSIDFTRQILTNLDQTRYSNIIVVSTVLEFKDIQFIGRLFILFNKEMFEKLKGALEDFLENI